MGAILESTDDLTCHKRCAQPFKYAVQTRVTSMPYMSFCGGSRRKPHTKKIRESRMSGRGGRSAVRLVFIEKAACI
eukprot:IDg19070t1